MGVVSAIPESRCLGIVLQRDLIPELCFDFRGAKLQLQRSKDGISTDHRTTRDSEEMGSGSCRVAQINLHVVSLANIKIKGSDINVTTKQVGDGPRLEKPVLAGAFSYSDVTTGDNGPRGFSHVLHFSVQSSTVGQLL